MAPHLLLMQPRPPPCTRVCTCAARSGRHAGTGLFALGASFSLVPHAQVIDNGLDLLMISPLERM